MPPPPPTPSQSLRVWTTDAKRLLDKIAGQCVWAEALNPSDSEMLDEHLRAYVTLLSAHFQGYCRDLYTESCLAVVGRIRQAGLRPIVQAQFMAGLVMDKKNPTLETLSGDFSRFGIARLNVAVGTDAPSAIRKGHLSAMNDCRNKCAHGERSIPELQLANLRDWRDSCNWLASRLNDVVYNTLWTAFRRPPWP